jgi:hypothetical protein
MEIPQDGLNAGMNIPRAAYLLGTPPDDLLLFLFRSGYLYRYTGVGQPRAYVRWVREGLFANRPCEVLMTQAGLDRIRRARDLCQER